MAKTDNTSIMEKLLASQSTKISTLSRGQQIEGEVVAITAQEVVLYLGTKSEGIIQTRSIPKDRREALKVGDRLKTYVQLTENESGQVVLSLEKQAPLRRPEIDRGFHPRGERSIDWSRFIQAQKQTSKLQGKVSEVNKGGLIVEVDSIRGFLPNSQVGFELLSKAGQGMENLIGQNLTVTVIEIDQARNKLIFSQRGQVSDEVKVGLNNFKNDQAVTGKIVAILPFGLVVDVSGVEGLVFISDVSWEKVDDLSAIFKVGEEIEVLVTGADNELGRLNLSIKQLKEDPFSKLAEKYPADEIIKGEIASVSDAGVAVKLDGIEGFLPASKMDPKQSYEVGKTITLLVDSVDTRKRVINLASMITSTEGLIYK